MKMILPYLWLWLLVLFLNACAPQSSVDRHAVHVAHQLSEANFDPHTRLLLADSIRQMRPCLQIVYDQGVKDRAAGLSRAQMEEKVASYLDPEKFPEETVKHRFLQQVYSADKPALERKILTEAMASVYRDGYEGRP